MVPEQGGSLMQVQVRNEQERLIAEQAVLAYREVQAAGEAAAHGQGMTAVEDATVQAGRQQMRLMLEETLGARPEAQKRGPVAQAVAVEQHSNERRPRR